MHQRWHNYIPRGGPESLEMHSSFPKATGLTDTTQNDSDENKDNLKSKNTFLCDTKMAINQSVSPESLSSLVFSCDFCFEEPLAGTQGFQQLQDKSQAALLQGSALSPLGVSSLSSFLKKCQGSRGGAHLAQLRPWVRVPALQREKKSEKKEEKSD